MLSPQQIDAWQDQGYLVLPDFKPPAALAEVRARAHALVEAFEPGAGTSRFSTRDRSLVADAALLASAHEVHGFLEEDALDERGTLRVPKRLSINKIGHALHERDPVFERFSHGRELAALAAALGLAQPQLRQSMLIFKQPRIGGEVGWHQDATFFVTKPHSVTTYWFALEDATLDNGCLWVQPGGHRGPLREQYVCHDGQLRMDRLHPQPWPDRTQATAVPAAAGTLVVFHGLLPHCSEPNRSPLSRLAYTLHVTDGRCDYAPQNWLQPSPALPLRGFV